MAASQEQHAPMLPTKTQQPVVVLQPSDVVPGVLVTAQGVAPKNPNFYISELCCWDNCKCSDDLALCCYSFWCPTCAYADLMANLDSPTCCCPVGFSYSFGCALGAGVATYVVQHILCSLNFSCLSWFANFVPCVTCTSREALGAKHGLPTHDCCCSCCAHYCCQTCALYQESVYVKHVLKAEPQCCCYENCCKPMCGAVVPGNFPGAPAAPADSAPRAASVVVLNSQPTGAVGVSRTLVATQPAPGSTLI